MTSGFRKAANASARPPRTRHHHLGDTPTPAANVIRWDFALPMVSTLCGESGPRTAPCRPAAQNHQIHRQSKSSCRARSSTARTGPAGVVGLYFVGFRGDGRGLRSQFPIRNRPTADSGLPTPVQNSATSLAFSSLTAAAIACRRSAGLGAAFTM